MIDIIFDFIKTIRNNFFGIVGIGALLYVLYFLFQARNSVKLTRDTMIVFTGTMGGGKTFNGVSELIKTYRRFRRTWRFRKIFFPFKNQDKWRPEVYTSIPIKIGKKWSNQIELEHLLFDLQFKGRPIVLFDEIGEVASQNDYDNEYVVDLLTNKVVRFFRHTTRGKLILTDQMSSSIYKGIRGRAGKVYNVSNFRKKFWFFAKMECVVYQQSEDNLQNVNIVNDKEQPYLFRIIGRTFKRYDSHCYSILYEDVKEDKNPIKWSKFKTKKFLKMPYRKLRIHRKDIGNSVPQETVINQKD